MRCLQSRGAPPSVRPYLGRPSHASNPLLLLFGKMPSRAFASGSIAPFRHLAISHLSSALFSSPLRCTVDWRSRAFRRCAGLAPCAFPSSLLLCLACFPPRRHRATTTIIVVIPLPTTTTIISAVVVVGVCLSSSRLRCPCVCMHAAESGGERERGGRGRAAAQ